MKVYTKTGDEGTTSLFSGERVLKNNVLVDAYGTVDECNAAIGSAASFLAAECKDSANKQALMSNLKAIQNSLFDLGAHLATPRSNSSASKVAKTPFSESATSDLESWIDEMETNLDPLTTFILPGGHQSAAALHVARTIARRAERMVTPLLLQTESDIDPAAYRFLNRLSDFLFVASRFANKIFDRPDVKWMKSSS